MRAEASQQAQGEGSNALAFVLAGLLAAMILLPSRALLDLKRADGTLAAALVALQLGLLAWRGVPTRRTPAALARALQVALAAWILCLITAKVRENAPARGLTLAAGLVLAWGAVKMPQRWADLAQRAWTFSVLLLSFFTIAAWGSRGAFAFGNSAYLSAFLVLSWPLFLIWDRMRPIAVMLTHAAVFATGSRAAILALALQWVVIFVYAWRKGWRPHITLISVLGAVTLCALLVQFVDWSRPTQRPAVWAASLKLWQRSPLFGQGAGNYPIAIEGLLDPDLAEDLSQKGQFAEDPHSVWLLLLCEGGLLALGAFLAILVAGWQATKDAPWFRLAVLGLLLESSVDRFFFQAGVFLPLCLGLGIASRQEGEGPVPSRRTAWVWFLAAVALSWSAVQPVLTWRQAVRGPAAGLPLDADPVALRKLATGSVDPAAWDRLGSALAAQGIFHEAEGAFLEASVLEPTVGRAINLGNCQFMQGKLAQAEATFRGATRFDPKSADAQFSLGYALFKQRKIADAVAALNEALRLQPGHAEASKLKEQILQ